MRLLSLIFVALSLCLTVLFSPLSTHFNSQAPISASYAAPLWEGSEPVPNVISVQIPASGTSSIFTIRVQNLGTETWQNSGADGVLLSYRWEPGDSGESNNTHSRFFCDNWMDSTRYHLSQMNEATVPSDGTATFNLWFCNPYNESVGSTFVEHFAVAHGGAWMPAEADVSRVKVQITIVADDSSAAPPQGLVTLDWLRQEPSGGAAIPVPPADTYQARVWFTSAGSTPNPQDLLLCLRKDPQNSSAPATSSVFQSSEWMAFNQVVEGETVSWCSAAPPSKSGRDYVFVVPFSGNNTATSYCSDQPTAPYCREDFGIVYNNNGTYTWVRSNNGREISSNRKDANVWWPLLQTREIPTLWRVSWKTQEPLGGENPVILTEGNDRQRVRVVITNRSNGPLHNSGADAVGLYIRQTDATSPPPEQFGTGAFACPEWLKPYHPVNMNEQRVEPGGDMTFEFDLCTNDVPAGIGYRIDFNVAHGVDFFETEDTQVATAWFPVRVITANPTPPRAQPGDAMTIAMGDAFRLDASASFDPDGGPLTTYRWRIVRDPDNNAVDVVLSESSQPVYNSASIPEAMNSVGTWILQLEVVDDEGVSATAERTVTVEQRIPALDVPWYSQRDSRWRYTTMRTCGYTIGSQGCLVTSAAMLFDYYGADTDSARLNADKGAGACLFQWTNRGTQGKAVYKRSQKFSYAVLEEELRNNRPVILGVGKDRDNFPEHWVLVVSGEGSDPANYRVNDPWPMSEALGKDRSLSNLQRIYPYLIRMAIYHPTGQTATRQMAAQSPGLFAKNSFSAQDEQFSGLAAISAVDTTALTATLNLDISSSNGNVVGMQIGTQPDLQGAVWVPYESQTAILTTAALTDTFYMRFEDDTGAVSEIVSDALWSANDQPVDATESLTSPFTILLPLVSRS